MKVSLREVIFTEIFSQLALPTFIHQLTGDNQCQNPDGPLNRKAASLLLGAPVVFTRQQYCELNDIPSHHFANGLQDVAKAERRANEPTVLPVHIAPPLHADVPQPVTNEPVTLFLPAEYGCAVSRHNLPMSSGRSNMLSPDNVFIAIKPADMRRGIDTLTQYIQDEPGRHGMREPPSSLLNKVRSRIKVLRWDKHGVVMVPAVAQSGSLSAGFTCK